MCVPTSKGMRHIDTHTSKNWQQQQQKIKKFPLVSCPLGKQLNSAELMMSP